MDSDKEIKLNSSANITKNLDILVCFILPLTNSVQINLTIIHQYILTMTTPVIPPIIINMIKLINMLIKNSFDKAIKLYLIEAPQQDDTQLISDIVINANEKMKNGRYITTRLIMPMP